MIDTDKYEGHSKEWTLNHNDWAWATSMFTDAGETNEADALLIADAPLLLEEVIRLREKYERLHNATENILIKHFGSLTVKAFWEAIE